MRGQFISSAIKALALDLDGTALLPDTGMGERTVRCLKRLKATGIQIIFCTGRAIEASYRYCSAVDADGPMVFFNGAEIADVSAPSTDGGVRLISSTLMNFNVVDFGIDVARSMGVHFHIFLPPNSIPGVADGWEALLTEKQSPESEMYRRHTGITPVVANLKEVIANPELKGCVKAMFIADPSLLEEIRGRMLARFGAAIYTARSFPTFLEIMNAGVSKGEGLKTVMNCRGLKPEEMIAFGDEENDLPMFSAAGFSAAPSGAKDKVRQAADFVFGSNAEEGLAAFLEEML